MKLALATCAALPRLPESEEPLLTLLKQQDIYAEPVIWNNAKINWQRYDAVLVRAVWDYHLHQTEFNHWLNLLEAKGIYTLNPVATIRHNHHKFYLLQLQQQGAEIIPTMFIPKTNSLDLSDIKSKGWKKAVIKPAVSAGAYLTRVFDVNEFSALEKEYRDIARERDLLVQPFLQEVIEQGEISLLFFNRKYSHAVLKVPQHGDFRVQQEHGGSTTPFRPEAALIATAERILSLVEGDLLYARIDGIMINGRFLLMELELIEPYLFFGYKEGAMEIFVRETVAMLRSTTRTRHSE